MTARISPLSDISSEARIGDDVTIGPFCVVGPHVTIGDGCTLDSHVTITGHTTIGNNNRFWPGCVIGAEPQDKSYHDGDTTVVIGDDNQFREGVTVNRGADKEDGCTRIENRNLLMSNAHVAHNCHIFNDAMLVNGVLLGGHVHIQDKAIVSGNTVVHHFATIGTLGFVSGGCRVVRDVPPYMLGTGSDHFEIRTINIIGMRRAGISEPTIRLIRAAYRRLYREHKPLKTVQDQFRNELDGVLPVELMGLLNFMEFTYGGKMGRGREAVRTVTTKEVKPNAA